MPYKGGAVEEFLQSFSLRRRRGWEGKKVSAQYPSLYEINTTEQSLMREFGGNPDERFEGELTGEILVLHNIEEEKVVQDFFEKIRVGGVSDIPFMMSAIVLLRIQRAHDSRFAPLQYIVKTNELALQRELNF